MHACSVPLGPHPRSRVPWLTLYFPLGYVFHLNPCMRLRAWYLDILVPEHYPGFQWSTVLYTLALRPDHDAHAQLVAKHQSNTGPASHVRPHSVIVSSSALQELAKASPAKALRSAARLDKPEGVRATPARPSRRGPGAQQPGQLCAAPCPAVLAPMRPWRALCCSPPCKSNILAGNIRRGGSPPAGRPQPAAAPPAAPSAATPACGTAPAAWTAPPCWPACPRGWTPVRYGHVHVLWG